MSGISTRVARDRRAAMPVGSAVPCRQCGNSGGCRHRRYHDRQTENPELAICVCGEPKWRHAGGRCASGGEFFERGL